MKRIIYFAFLLAMVSCSQEELCPTSDVISNDFTEISIIPQEKALATLRSFMDSVEGEMPPTKSGEGRKISTVDTYYISNPTKSAESIPAAYVVNFENNEGFAVLGANSNVADIVAVTESGNIDPVTFAVRDSLVIDPEPVDPIFPLDPVLPDEDDIPSDFEWYCDEDDDYFICSPQDLTPIKRYLMLAVHTVDGTGGSSPGGPSSGGDDSLFPGDGNTGGGGSDERPYNECETLMQTNWEQGDWQNAGVYNKYCIKNNGKIALAGCSIVSCAMILTQNSFPQTLRVNGTSLNYSRMKERSDANALSSQYAEHVSLLMGGLFNNIDRLFAFRCGTCVTPRQIELFMEDMGYTNVYRHCSNSFTQSILASVSSMLGSGLPVFVSAFRGACDGHSWVVDGSRYTDGDSYCLHCNWGWGGSCNGYYSYTCFNPGDGEYDTRFRVITYNRPSTHSTRSLDF